MEQFKCKECGGSTFTYDTMYRMWCDINIHKKKLVNFIKIEDFGKPEPLFDETITPAYKCLNCNKQYTMEEINKLTL